MNFAFAGFYLYGRQRPDFSSLIRLGKFTVFSTISGKIFIQPLIFRTQTLALLLQSRILFCVNHFLFA